MRGNDTSTICSSVHYSVPLRRELAFQIYKEYERFSKYFDNIKTAVFFGGISIKKDEETLQSNCPHIVVGTPGRVLALIRDKTLNLKHVKHFILDECDKMLEQLGTWLVGFYWSLFNIKFIVYLRT